MNGNPSFFYLFVAALITLAVSFPANARKEDLLEMARKLEQLDQQDLLTALDKADACTIAHDFACADMQLSEASKFATDSRNQQTLEAARRKLADEKAKWATTH